MPGRFENGLRHWLESRFIRPQPFLRPVRQSLLNGDGHAFVLDDFVVGIDLGLHDLIGALFDDFLIGVGGLVPFLEPLHALAEGEIVQGFHGVADVDAFGGVAGLGIGAGFGGDGDGTSDKPLSGRLAVQADENRDRDSDAQNV